MKFMLFRSFFISVAVALLGCLAFSTTANALYGEATLVEYPGYALLQGPAKAKGIIVWSPGSGGDRSPDAATGSVPHFMDVLYGSGWDVLYMQRGDNIDVAARPAHARALKNAVSGLRSSGYKHIVLAGQSSGGTYTLIAAEEDLGLHAIVLLASGPESSTQYYDFLKKSKAQRYLFAYFRNDKTVTVNRVPQSVALIRGRGQPVMGINQPQGIEGHNGSYLSTFSYRFSDCIAAFLEPDINSNSSACDGR